MWDSPTLINLTNLTREVRYRQVSDLFLLRTSRPDGDKAVFYTGKAGRSFPARRAHERGGRKRPETGRWKNSKRRPDQHPVLRRQTVSEPACAGHGTAKASEREYAPPRTPARQSGRK